MARSTDMLRGHPAKLLTAFALPLMLGNIFQQLYTVVDTAIVGRGVGMQALAALGSVDWMNWMFLGIAQGFTQGFSVRMSQKYGQRDFPALKRAIGISARLTVWISLVALAVSQGLLPLFLRFLRVSDTLRPMAELYSRILMAGIPAVLFYNFCASVLRAVGDSKTPLMAMVAAALTNIALDCLTVFVLGWGIAGAAAATVASQLLSGALCARRIFRSDELRFAKSDTLPDAVLTRTLMGLGTPMAVQNIIIAVGGMAIQSVVNRFDTGFIAGFTATNKLYGILEIAALSYGYAVTTYTGQNFGAERLDRIRKGTSWAAAISLLTAAVIGTVMLIFGRQITMLFISRENPVLAREAGEVAYRYLAAMSLALPVLYLLYVYRSALQGMGDTRTPLISGVVELVIRVGSASILAFTLWRDGLFLAEVCAWLGAAILLAGVYYYRTYKK